MNESSRPRVLVIHSTVWPYRLPTFETLSERFDLEVVFCKRREAGRRWNTDLSEYSFDSTVLDHIDVGPFVLNPGLVRRLLFTDYDVYVIDGYDPYLPSMLLGLLAAKLRRKPVVLWTEHFDSRSLGWWFARSSIPKRVWVVLSWVFVNTYQSLLYPAVDRFVALSEKAKRYLIRRGVDRDRIETSKRAMPSEFLSAPPADVEDLAGISDEQTTILYLGGLQEGKGLDTLVESYKRLDPENAQLVLAGTGPEREYLEALAGSRSDVHFPGYVDGSEKTGYYAHSDLFVLPSRFDAWGLVVNEAMHFGLPVITTTDAGSECIINDGENGFVIAPDDPDQLEDRLRTLLEDDDLRREMGEGAEATSEALDPDVMATALTNAIDAATGHDRT